MKFNSKIVIIGGGFAGARTAQDLVKNGFNDVTLIDRKDYFEVTYATLRGVTQPNKWGTSSRKKYTDFFNGRFLQASVREMSKTQIYTDSGELISFDYAVIATGSSYPSFQIGKSSSALSLEQRNMHFEQENKKLVKANNIVIVGGGPVGVELAGEIADYYPGKNVTLIQKSDRLLNGFRKKTGETAHKLLSKLGVRVLLNDTMEENINGEYFTTNSKQLLAADLIYNCVGVKVNTDWLTRNFSHTLNDHGHLRVDDFLRVESYDNIFAIGDCSNIKEAKLGYLADIQGEAVAKNMLRLVKGKKLKAYKTNPDVVLVPTGRESGLVQLPFAVTTLNFLVNMKQKDLFILKAFKGLGVKQSINQA